MRQAVGLSLPSIRAHSALPRPRIALAVLVIAVCSLRFAYLISNCPLDLAADEAHYWDWSRRLDWSYYSKGPLVAWLIRLSCSLAGGWSEQLVGSPMLAIRLPAILCHAGVMIAVYWLAVRVTRSEWKALATVAVGLTMPVIEAGGTLMTIDAPFSCCWAWGLVFGHEAILRGRGWAWLAMGVAVGLGILAKYTMVFFLPLVGLFLLTNHSYRPMLLRSGYWLACLIALACCLPIVIWNVQHDWISFRHVGTQATGESNQWRWWGPARFTAEQSLVLMVFWFVSWVGAAWTNRPGQARDPGRQYLWWLSVPVFLVFLAISLRTSGQINWPIAAWIGGLILAVDWQFGHWQRASPGYRNVMVCSLTMATGLGMVLVTATHFPQLSRPLFAAIGGPPSAGNPTPLRKYDPTARLRGWRYLAAEVDRIRAALRAEGEEPIIAAAYWNLPAELAVYCAGHPEVYCFGAALRQRHSQYDLWRPNPAWDPEQYAGRTVIYIGDVATEVTAAFERMEQSQYVEYSEGGRPLVYWNVTVGRGYRGFGSPDNWPGQRRY